MDKYTAIQRAIDGSFLHCDYLEVDLDRIKRAMNVYKGLGKNPKEIFRKLVREEIAKRHGWEVNR